MQQWWLHTFVDVHPDPTALLSVIRNCTRRCSLSASTTLSPRTVPLYTLVFVECAPGLSNSGWNIS